MGDGLAGEDMDHAVLHADQAPKPDKGVARTLLRPMVELLAMVPPHSLLHVTLLPAVSCKLIKTIL